MDEQPSADAIDRWGSHVRDVLQRQDSLRDVASRLTGKDAETLRDVAWHLEAEFELRLMVMPLAYQDRARQATASYRALHPRAEEPRAPLDWTEIEAELAQGKATDADFLITGVATMGHLNAEAARQKAEAATGPEAQELWRKAAEAKAEHQAELGRMPPLTRAYALKSIESFKGTRLGAAG